MTAFKLAAINIRGRMRDYLTFLISNGVLVATFYIFAAIFYNDTFSQLQSSTTYQPGFFAFAIVVLIFTAIFVWYSSSFFIRKRKQEIATYLLVGMSKRKVSGMLFAEQVLIGLISLAAGLVAGILLYKFFMMVLVSLMHIDIAVNFVVSWKAILTSVLVFSLLDVVNAVFVSTLVHRAKLINLYKAQTITEKKVKTRWLIGVLGFALLAGGYIKSVVSWTPPIGIDDLMIVLGLVIVGTYLFMGAFLTLLIRLMSRNKKRYYKARNLTSLSQLAFRIRSNAMSLATIAILNAMVLTVLGSMWSVYTTQAAYERYYQPFDMQYVASAAYDDVDADVDAVIKQYDDISVTGDMRLELPRIMIDDVGKGYVVSQSQFNEAAGLTGQVEEVDLQDDEMLYTAQGVYDWGSSADFYEELGQKETIAFRTGDADYVLRPVDIRADKITNGYNVGTVLVVSDDTYAQIRADAGDDIAYLRGLMLDDPLLAEDMIDEIDRVIPGELDGENGMLETGLEIDRDLESYVFRYRDAFATLGIALFFAFFIGIMFLVVTGSVLYYKQMAESDNDQKRYRVLSNIGMSPRQISSSVGIQLSIIFGVPLVLGAIDALFALSLLDHMLPNKLMLRAVMVLVMYAVMYSIYFLITWRNYRKKVRA